MTNPSELLGWQSTFRFSGSGGCIVIAANFGRLPGTHVATFFVVSKTGISVKNGFILAGFAHHNAED